MAHAGRVITAALAQNYRRALTLMRRERFPLESSSRCYNVTQRRYVLLLLVERLASAHVMLFLGLCTFDWRRQFELLARGYHD